MMGLKTIFTFALLFSIPYLALCQDFDHWDKDQDGYITDYEFRIELLDNDMFRAHDINLDGELSKAEWETTNDDSGFLKPNYFKEWDKDQDNFLTENEFINGAYQVWDVDSDGYIADSEYEAYYVEWEIGR